MLKFLRLPSVDKMRTLEASGFVLVARFLLVAVPFRRTVALATFLGERLPARGSGNLQQMLRLSYLVQRVSRHVPGATCLTQAVALKLMLIRRRIACNLRIGVQKEDGVFKAHAWLENSAQQVIIGGSRSPQQYKPLKLDLGKSL